MPELQLVTTIHMLVVLLGYLVFGFCGFGSALIVIPLLSWYLPLTTVVALVLMLDIVSSIVFTGLNFKYVAWREFPHLLPSVIVGSMLGMVLIAYAKNQWLLGGLGLYVALVGVRGVKNVKQSISIHNIGASLMARRTAGLLMGLVETMFGAAGPIVVSWLSTRLANPHQLRATVAVALFFLSWIALGSTLSAGQLDLSAVWKRFMMLAPCALLGVWLGHQLAIRVNPEAFRRLIYGLLILSGCALGFLAIASSCNWYGCDKT